jgi:hypothetical protein
MTDWLRLSLSQSVKECPRIALPKVVFGKSHRGPIFITFCLISREQESCLTIVMSNLILMQSYSRSHIQQFSSNDVLRTS